MGVLDTLGAATAARRSVRMCVDGALQAEWDRTKEELEDAGRSDADTGSLALPAVTAVVNRLEDLRDAVAASEVEFVFERWDWVERIQEQATHPPRKGNLADALRGYNVETFLRVQIRRSCISVTDAEGDVATEIPDDVWDRLLGRPATEDAPALKGSLNTRQVNQLLSAATEVNDGDTTVPPSARSLLESQDSGASLAQPDPGKARPRSGSAAGSRRTSPRSSTTKKATARRASKAGSPGS